MKKFLVNSGGVGDQLLAYSEFFENYRMPGRVDVVVKRICYRETIREFWNSQGIECNIIPAKSLMRLGIDPLNCEEFKNKYKVIWDGDLKNKRCPFPLIKYNHINGIDIIFNICSGHPKSRRQFHRGEIIKFIDDHKDRKIFLTGLSDLDDLDLSNIVNMVNKTTLTEYMNLICSSNIVITHNGFCSFLSGMMKKKVFVFPELGITEKQIDPSWNMIMINSLDEVEL